MLRGVNLLLFSVSVSIIYFFFAGYVFILVLVLVAVVRPYRKKWQNFVDIALLLCILTHYLFKNSIYEVTYMTPDGSKLHLALVIIVNILSLLFPAFYSLLALTSFIIPRCCIVKVNRIVNGCLRKDLEEPLPHRLQQSNECSPLIK